MGDDYALLTESTVAAYLAAHPELASRIDPRTVCAREIGDGNLNLVFVCCDDHGRSLVLKQSIPWVRAAGPSWPLTADRSHAEARGLTESSRVAPTTSVELISYDAAEHVLALEDLSHLRPWRARLLDGAITPGVTDACGRHLARLAFGTGMLGRPAHDVRAAMGHAANPELCRITEDLVFTEPYGDHPNNRDDSSLAEAVTALRSDRRVRDAVSRLKLEFTTRADALVHGDLHTGSIMVGDGDRPETKVIDAEFCFHGPIAFDLGSLLGHLLIATARAAALGAEAQRRWLEEQPAELWAAFCAEFWTQWPYRADLALTDASAQQHLDRFASDAVGFAACEAIRRVIGLAQVADLETLPHLLRAPAARAILATAHRWLVCPGPITAPLLPDLLETIPT